MTDYRVMLSSDHLRAVDLLEKPRLVTIVKVTQGEYEARERGKKPKKMPDVHFAEYPGQPLGCNSTNGRAIAKLLGSTHVENWVGRKIVLRPETVDAFGEQKLAIRVDPRLPKDDPGPQRSKQARQPGAPQPQRTAGAGTSAETTVHRPPPITPEEAAEIERQEREEQNR